MRKTGRTTRLADKYIQELFEKGEVEVKDHFRTSWTSFKLLNIMLDRLENEHPETFKNIKVRNPSRYLNNNSYKIIIEKKPLKPRLKVLIRKLKEENSKLQEQINELLNQIEADEKFDKHF